MDKATQVLARRAPSGVTKSFRTLADHSDVPRTTLQHRARGRPSIETKKDARDTLFHATPLSRNDESYRLAELVQASTLEANTEARAKRQTWRVRGVPLAFDKDRLTDTLRSHASLSPSNELDDNGASIHTLAPDVRLPEQLATVRFRNTPTRLESLNSDSYLRIDILADDAVNTDTNTKGKQNTVQTAILLIDQHFDGITVLASPAAEHHVDILAISGLGSHPFGSFVHKEDGHMWLADSLPRDLPSTRVMIYGYKSGLQNSTSFASLEDLASSLQIALCSLLRSRKKRLILIGHSLGGLLVKEALIRMADSKYDSDLVGLVFGCLFFGVPNDGMDIESLMPIVNNQPNRQLLESLDAMNPQILRLQGRNFSKVLDQADFELFCFYETRWSPTAAKDPSTGQYRMNGPPRCLVTATSATSCLPPGVSSDHSAAIDRSHSDLVKLATRDAAYDNISYILGQIYQRCVAVSKKSTEKAPVGDDNELFLVPYARNPDFVGRTAVLERLKGQLGGGQQSQARSALYGLGGVGKTQVALAYAYWLREESPETSVFWVHASSAERFRQGFTSIAEACKVPGYDDAKADVLSLVKRWLEKKNRGPWLMVIDNADDVQVFFGRPTEFASTSTASVASAATVSNDGDLGRHIPECAHGAVLITTRNKQVGLRLMRGQRPIEIGRMSDDESGQLLRASLDGDVASDNLSALSTRLEHLPLALVQAAAFMQENTVTIGGYLALLDKGDQGLVDLLSQEFETVGRDSGTPRAVAATWMLSFEQIQRQDELAGDLLSLMSLLDRQAIPVEFLSIYSRQQGRQVEDVQLTKAIGHLKAFSLVTEDKDGSLDMHRLVQLITRKWLTNKGTMRMFAGQALLAVSHAYPYGMFETRATCHAYLPHAQTVLDLEGSGSEDEAVAKGTLLHYAAGFFLVEGLWNDAEKCLKQAVDIRREVLGEEHPSTLASMANLASTFSNQGRWTEAESLEVQVMETGSRVLGEEHPSTLTSMANLASTYRNQGRWTEAESLEVQVMETSSRVLGEEHPSTLTSMANLASTFWNQGRWTEAESLEVQVMETSSRVLGEEHPSTLTSMANLASTYRNQGRWTEAESLEVQVMETSSRVLGEEHPDTLTSMADLASTYRNQGRWTEAESLEVQVMETSSRVLGEEHPSTLTSMANLASTFWNQGRWTEVEDLQAKELKIYSRMLGEEHPDTLTSMANLASTYRNQGRWTEAEDLQAKELKICSRMLGEEHPDTLTSMNNLAHIWKSQGRDADALALMRDCAQIRQRVIGSEHPLTFSSLAVVRDWS